jgi:hypothetical protein
VNEKVQNDRVEAGPVDLYQFLFDETSFGL